MQKTNPYEYYEDKLGVKIKFLISDKSRSSESLDLIKYRSLSHRMNSKTCSEKQLRRSSLGLDALIEFNSLSQEWRDRITVKFGAPVEQIKQSWFAKHYIADKAAFDFYVAHRYGDNNDKKLKLDLVEKYTYNASVLNTVLKVKKNRKAYAKALGGVSFNIWESLSKDVNAFRDVAHDLPTTPDSLRYKTTRFQKEGYSALISGKLKLKNARKVKEKEQFALLEELINKHQNFDNVFIADMYNLVASKMEWETISPGTVANIKSDKKLETFAGRQGKKGLKTKMLMQHKRFAPTAPMKYWTLDGWDVELLYQKRVINKDGHKVTTYHNRLTMVVVLDPFNKYPVGYAIGERETPHLIKHAIQNAISHTKDLFGSYLKPHELQSDNYQIKNLRPYYEKATANFNPAGVGNSQAKIIEPWFKYLNTKKCRIYDNWSGFNTNTGSKNQPNVEVMNKLKKNFPTREGLEKQIHYIMNQERKQLEREYIAGFRNTEDEFRHVISKETFLLTLGFETEFNTLRGEGLRTSINGSYRWFDSFDMNFRKHSAEKWKVHYLEGNLDDALAVSTDDSYRFPVIEKYVEGMALADRSHLDEIERDKIDSFNRSAVKYIKQNNIDRASTVETLFASNPELNQTTAKLLLTDSAGQHKIHKRRASEGVKAGKKKVISIDVKEAQTVATTFEDKQLEYLKSKVNASDYLED
ncbi:hypothetical protein MC378_10260 [Polaribacter sp. MSW13]|uniref:Integrase catalytic domain-containing protein n=1 Tax=Polaribacter marinus TaxID=2916838 RepID=A0A9X1VNW1_9FLAO|nr:hypothetical protein [Polaribacter marinus]MCI2229550.1 hypothetical protein [Polaribacter marinus]